MDPNNFGLDHPVHISWARLMLQHMINGNGITKYKHTTGPVFWGPYDKQPYYISITDCSGFINALIKKSYNLNVGWAGVPRPYASTYYRLTLEQKFFTEIKNIHDLRIGDFIIFKILPGTSKSDNTGHIMLANGLPKNIISKTPFVPKTLQWAVNIIDQSSAHGKNDSRFLTKSTGLGTGFLRIYTDYDGTLQGYCWSTDPNSKYIDKSFHPLVIGRLVI